MSCQTLQALQTVKTGREFLSRRGAPLSSARWGLRRFLGELCPLKQWHFLNILVRPRLNSSWRSGTLLASKIRPSQVR